jgi:hypothetical protein
MLIALPFAVVAGSAPMVVAGALAASGVGLGVLVDSRRNPRWMALRAVYRGREVELFSSTRRRDFELVRLAVIRAVEAERNSRPLDLIGAPFRGPVHRSRGPARRTSGGE